MKEFKKRQSKSTQALQLARSFAGLLALMVVAFLALRATGDMYNKFAEAAAARSAAEAQLADLNSRYTAVKAQVDALGSQRGQEAALRERYGVARAGESELDIVRSSSSTPAVAEPQSIFGRLWHLLFVW